jgi:hypothetical protein
MPNSRVSVEWTGTIFVSSYTTSSGTTAYKYSADGETWESAEVPTDILTANQIQNVKYIGNRAIITGNLAIPQGNVQLTSMDGIHYGVTIPDNTKQIHNIEIDAEFRNTVRFSHKVMLALGTSGISYSLNDGDTWSASAGSVFNTVANDAKWNGRMWVAVGDGSSNTIATSEDGEEWMGRGKFIFSEEATSIEWSKEANLWVATGSDTNNGYSVANSVDGVHWIGKQIANMVSGTFVRYNGELWVLAGVPAVGTANSIAYSSDGLLWTSIPNMFSTRANKVEWDGTHWTVFGEDPSYNIATSANGINWTLQTIQNPVSAPLYDGTYFWRINSGNTTTYSKSIDGQTWTTLSANSNLLLTNVHRFVVNTPNEAISTIQPATIATGEGDNTLAYSADGIFWKGLGKNVFTERANQSAWNGRIWVAVGKGGNWVATSYDGSEWIGRDSSLMTEGYSVAWNGVRFVAVGKGNATIATSVNGISWEPISGSTALFTEECTKVVWTGKKWLVYGSGTNTTATSTDGLVWSPTNAVVQDASSVFQESGYFTSASLSGFTATSSSEQSDYEAYNAFDNVDATLWRSVSNRYNSGTGIYSGPSSPITYTSISNGQQTVEGEWLEVSIPTAKTIKHYKLSFLADNTDRPSIPKEWKLFGLNDGSGWNELHSFQFDTNTAPTTNFILPIHLHTNTTAYTHYRLVVLRTFNGTYSAIAGMDLYEDNANSRTISRYETPVVLKNNVLFLSSLGSSQPVYHLANLSLETLNSRPTNAGVYVKSVINGLSVPSVTSVCFDGEYTYASDPSGNITVLTNTESNTSLGFNTEINGYTINHGLSAVYSSCWNRQFVLFAGVGGISYGRMDAQNQWNLTNAGDLFSTVYGVSSNSEYGFVYVPNTIYFHTNEILRVVAPKSCPFVGETDIQFQLHNSNS